MLHLPVNSLRVPEPWRLFALNKKNQYSRVQAGKIEKEKNRHFTNKIKVRKIYPFYSIW